MPLKWKRANTRTISTNSEVTSSCITQSGRYHCTARDRYRSCTFIKKKLGDEWNHKIKYIHDYLLQQSSIQLTEVDMIYSRIHTLKLTDAFTNKTFVFIISGLNSTYSLIDWSKTERTLNSERSYFHHSGDFNSSIACLNNIPSEYCHNGYL